jgi:hypothetical protein
MSEKEILDKKALELEKERILLLFEKEKYNNQQKKWFLESKMIGIEKSNDQELMNVYKELLEMIEKEEK